MTHQKSGVPRAVRSDNGWLWPYLSSPEEEAEEHDSFWSTGFRLTAQHHHTGGGVKTIGHQPDDATGWLENPYPWSGCCEELMCQKKLKTMRYQGRHDAPRARWLREGFTARMSHSYPFNGEHTIPSAHVTSKCLREDSSGSWFLYSN